jgi:hypothetical protein
VQVWFSPAARLLQVGKGHAAMFDSRPLTGALDEGAGLLVV